jgi:hypothetical protein
VARQRALAARGAAVSSLLAGIALVASGCGKTALQEFADRLRPLDRQVAQQKAQLAATLRTARLRNHDDSRLLRQEIRVLALTQGQIARLGAPGEVKVPLARYAGASAAQISVLNRFASALDAGDKASLTALAQQTQSSEGAVRRADDALHATLNSG